MDDTIQLCAPTKKSYKSLHKSKSDN